MRGRPTKREKEREREREREKEREYARISGRRKIIISVFAEVFHILILKELMS